MAILKSIIPNLMLRITLPVYFLPENKIVGDSVRIEGDNYYHLAKVLRCRIDEIISVSDGKRTYFVRIEEIYKDFIKARILQEKEISSSQEFTLIQSLPKKRKMDIIIRQAAELGVNNIIPVISQRSIPRLDGDKQDKLLSRWQRIAKESAQNASSGISSNVEQIQEFSDILKKIKEFDLVLIPWEEEKAKKIKDVLSEFPSAKKIAIIIGPEGGFTADEVGEAVKNGALCVTLGKNIFRTEIAGLLSVIIVKYALEWL